MLSFKQHFSSIKYLNFCYYFCFNSYSEEEEELGYFDLDDFVPSSNPDDYSDYNFSLNLPGISASSRNQGSHLTEQLKDKNFSSLVEVHQKEDLKNGL